MSGNQAKCSNILCLKPSSWGAFGVSPGKEDVVTNSSIRLGLVIACLFVAATLGGCGGTKVLKEPQPIQTTQTIATASDELVTASIDWVIVRDGPGTWAKNVDWDEYLIRIQNLGDSPLQVMGIVVVDSVGERVESQESRRQLVKGTKQTKRRYKGEGLKVKAGAGAGVLVAASAASWGVMGVAAFATGAMAPVAAVGGLVMVPVFAVGGVMRGVNNSKVNNQIELRQTAFPLEVPANAEQSLDVFFPLAPSPKIVELVYSDAAGEHVLLIDTSTALEGLHIEKPAE
jgi:hypothetical protein